MISPLKKIKLKMSVSNKKKCYYNLKVSTGMFVFGSS